MPSNNSSRRTSSSDLQDRLNAYNETYHHSSSKKTLNSNSDNQSASKPSNRTPSMKAYNTRDLSVWTANKEETANNDDGIKMERKWEFQKTFVQHTNNESNNKKRDICMGGGEEDNDSSDSPVDDSSTRNNIGNNSKSPMAKERLSEYQSRFGNSSFIEDPNCIVPLLAAQSYHIPGNTWGQDWRQFMCNSHPLFGICLHHKLHPIKSTTRIVALIGIFVFGLAMTNLFYLFYLLNPEWDRTVLSVVLSSGEIWTLTTGMLLLWTLGSGIQASFNLTLWYIAACACCRPGGCLERRACCPSFGKHLIRVLIFMIFVMAILILLMRVAISNTTDTASTNGSTSAEGEEGEDTTNERDFDFFFTSEAWDFDLDNAEDGFQFMLAYVVQMGLSLFIYYPLIGTILMSGVVGCCGRSPIFGGRPYEVKQWEKKQERILKEQERMEDWELANSTTGSSSDSSGDGRKELVGTMVRTSTSTRR